MSDSLQLYGLQHIRLPYPSPTPGACSNSCPLNLWCYPTISSSVVPFSCLQSFPASGSFQMSQFFPSGGQSIGVSASASVLPMNIQDWFPLGLTGLISLLSKGLSRVFSNTTTASKASILRCSAFFMAQLSHPFMTTGKTIALTRWTFVSKVMCVEGKFFGDFTYLKLSWFPFTNDWPFVWVTPYWVPAFVMEWYNEQIYL